MLDCGLLELGSELEEELPVAVVATDVADVSLLHSEALSLQ
jgi:hypothetical protein